MAHEVKLSSFQAKASCTGSAGKDHYKIDTKWPFEHIDPKFDKQEFIGAYTSVKAEQGQAKFVVSQADLERKKQL